MENNIILSEFDKLILNKLKTGLKQTDISNYLKDNKIEPYSLRSIEHRINSLKKKFETTTLVSLIYVLSKKDYI